MSPFGERQFLFVEKKLAFFGDVNHVGPDEKLQGMLAVIASCEHPAEYGLRFQLQLVDGHGILFAYGVLLPELPDYFGDGTHCQPVGQEEDR
jgi:hypothetical protein